MAKCLGFTEGEQKGLTEGEQKDLADDNRGKTRPRLQ